MAHAPNINIVSINAARFLKDVAMMNSRIEFIEDVESIQEGNPIQEYAMIAVLDWDPEDVRSAIIELRAGGHIRQKMDNSWEMTTRGAAYAANLITAEFVAYANVQGIPRDDAPGFQFGSEDPEPVKGWAFHVLTMRAGAVLDEFTLHQKCAPEGDDWVWIVPGKVKQMRIPGNDVTLVMTAAAE